MSIGKGHLFKILWAIVNLIFLVLASYIPALISTVLVLATTTNILLIIALRRIQPAMIMALFFLSYLLFLFPYYFKDYIIVVYSHYYKPELFNKALIIHSLFINSFYFFLKPDINLQQLALIDLIPTRPSKYLFYMLLGVLVLTVVSIQGQSLVGDGEGSYEAYMENLEDQGGMLEYFYLLFIAAFFFTTNQKQRKFLLLVALLYCFQCVIRGYRIQMIQMAMLLFILYFDNYFKIWKILLLCVFGIIMSEIISALKMTGGIDFDTLVKGIDFAKEGEVLISNQTDVFYSSVVFLGLIQDGILDVWIRIYSMLGFVLNWFVPSSFVWQEARLPSYSKNFTELGGGGLVSVYIFVWFGYIGVVLLGLLLAQFLNFTFNGAIKKLYKIIVVIILAVFPRWFAYDPGNFLFRFSIYLIIIYYILFELSLYFKKNHERENFNN